MSAFGSGRSGSCSRDDRPVVDIEHKAFQFLSDCARSGDELGRPFSEFFGLPKALAQYVPHRLHDVTISRGHQPGFRNPRWLNVSLMGGKNAASLVQYLPITRVQWTRGGKSKLMSSFFSRTQQEAAAVWVSEMTTAEFRRRSTHPAGVTEGN